MAWQLPARRAPVRPPPSHSSLLCCGGSPAAYGSRRFARRPRQFATSDWVKSTAFDATQKPVVVPAAARGGAPGADAAPATAPSPGAGSGSDGTGGGIARRRISGALEAAARTEGEGGFGSAPAAATPGAGPERPVGGGAGTQRPPHPLLLRRASYSEGFHTTPLTEPLAPSGTASRSVASSESPAIDPSAN